MCIARSFPRAARRRRRPRARSFMSSGRSRTSNATATGAVAFDVRDLPDDMKDLARGLRRRRAALGKDLAMHMRRRLDGVHRTDRRAAATAGAAVVPPADDIGELP